MQMQSTLQIKQEKLDSYSYNDDEELPYIEVEEIILEEDDGCEEVLSWNFGEATPENWATVAIKMETQDIKPIPALFYDESVDGSDDHNTGEIEYDEVEIKVELEEDLTSELHECPQCHKKVEPDRLKPHMDNCMASKKQLPGCIEFADQKELYKCSICGKEYSHAPTFKLHLKLHTALTDWECNQCDFRCRRPHELRAHKNSHFNASIGRCLLCHASLKNMKLLKEHMMLHNNKMFPCHLCKYCGMYDALLKHIDNIHGGVKSVKCGQCKEMFVTQPGMMRHRQRCHETKSSGHQCALCLKYFNSAISRDDHFMICLSDSVSREKFYPVKNIYTFKCKLCEYTGKSKFGLTQHIAAKHTIKDETYKCELCTYVGRSAGGLAHHRSIKHKNVKPKPMTYDCGICQFIATNGTNLSLHIINKHNSVKTFPCDKCTEMFMTRQSMLWHSKRYHEKTRHKCRKCLKYYKTKHVLAAHRKSFCAGSKKV